MAEEAKKFDLYLGDEKVQEGVTVPIEITGLKPATKYDYALAYAGLDAKAPFSFTTEAAPVQPSTTTSTTAAPVQPSTTTSTTAAPVQPSTTTSTTVGA